jgi:hypothetical protein
MGSVRRLASFPSESLCEDPVSLIPLCCFHPQGKVVWAVEFDAPLSESLQQSLVEQEEDGRFIWVHLCIHGEQQKVGDVLVNVSLLYLQFMKLVLRLFLHSVVHECLFKIMFHHLPCVSRRRDNGGVFLRVLQPEGLHPGPPLCFCPGHEGEEVRCLLNGVSGDGRCLIQ